MTYHLSRQFMTLDGLCSEAEQLVDAIMLLDEIQMPEDPARWRGAICELHFVVHQKVAACRAAIEALAPAVHAEGRL